MIGQNTMNISEIFCVHGFVRLSVTRNSYLEANLVLFAQRSPKGSNLCGVI